MTDLDPQALAAELATAEADQAGVPLLTERFPHLTWAEARSVALARDELRARAGDRMVGYKLGWTSAAMREALGIDRPNWGTLWTSMDAASPSSGSGTITRHRHRHPKVEPELVYRAARPLMGDVTADEVGTSGTWALGLEVVDPHFPSYDFGWLDNTADNSSASAFVVGEDRLLGRDVDEVTVHFSDGADPRRGRADQAMGSPREAVAWLVRSLATEGRGLDAGHIVFTGGLAAPFDLFVGSHVVVEAAGWDPVSLDVV